MNSGTCIGGLAIYRSASMAMAYCATRQGEKLVHVRMVSAAQLAGLSAWQDAHALGTLSISVAEGGMNLKVWLRTLMSAMVCSILGMWHAMHSLPALSALWCVCASMVVGRGPLGEFGPWHCRHRTLAGRIRSALFSVPCTSWQVKHVMPWVYITLFTKSFPCMRFLLAVH